MSRILAFVDEFGCSRDVLATADALARLLGVTVDVIHVAEEPESPWSGSSRARHIDGNVDDVLARSLDDPDVLAGVIGSRNEQRMSKLLGHVAKQLCVSTATPLVVVPPGSGEPSDPFTAVVPLDGTEATAAAVAPIVRRLQRSGAVIVSTHVFDHDALPPLMSSAEDVRTVAAEFDAVHLHGQSDSVELRIGDAQETVPDLARRVHADAVVVAWGQNLGPGRAAVIRRLIEADVRIVLVPRAAAG